MPSTPRPYGPQRAISPRETPTLLDPMRPGSRTMLQCSHQVEQSACISCRRRLEGCQYHQGRGVIASQMSLLPVLLALQT